MKFIAIFLFTILFVACEKGNEVPENKDWPTTIDFFASTLESSHKNLFFQLPQAEFYRMTQTLKQQCDTLSDVEVVLEISKILTKVGDAHTGLSPKCDIYTFLPFQFLSLSDGFFCYSAPSNYHEMIGEVLASIDGTSMETVRSKFAEIIPHENEPKLQQGIRNYLACPEVLNGLGITSEKEDFTFNTISGHSVTVVVKTISGSNVNYFAEKELPLYLQNTGKKYWFTSIEEEKMVYVQYNSCSEYDDNPFATLTKEVFDEVERISADKLVIDLRWNGGGSSSIFSPMLKAIVNQNVLNQENHLYVITGKATFSSALLNALELQEQTNAILIGEPTGGKPNHYGEVETFRLNKLGITVQYSTKYFKRVEGDPPSLEPDILVPTSSKDMLNLTDPVLEYIVNH
ncbi:MAG: hypothetical protein ACERKD_01250 [Prolixibacteraceae bacterium]